MNRVTQNRHSLCHSFRVTADGRASEATSSDDDLPTPEQLDYVAFDEKLLSRQPRS